ncbi:MAG: preprotein translocase subunit YajC, partial [Alteraurantiacibacter sp.]|nr:preprotein translocase subunit YajC [Alteraurantiacibacter sp.]
MLHPSSSGLLVAAVLGAILSPAAASAQSQASTAVGLREDASRSSTAARSRGVTVQPYIEAAQVLSAELTPGNDVVTYTRLAAGVDAGFAGRNSAGSLSLRYERRIGYG